jgi:hypothetical protein
MNFILQPWHIVLLTVSRNFNDTGADDYLRGTGIILNGVVQHSSDRNLKEGFTAIDAEDVLSKVLDIPITTWRFKSEDDEVKHIGPVA